MSRLLLKLLLLPPDLLKMHVNGYADLAAEEWARYLCVLKTRWLLYAIGTASCVLGVFLAGVSLLLWSALTVVDAHSVWIMWCVPSVLGLLALVCLVWAKRIKMSRHFGKLKAQVELDIQGLRSQQAP